MSSFLRRKQVILAFFVFFLLIFIILATVPAGNARPLDAVTVNDELVEALAYGFDTLDPALAYDLRSIHAIQQIYEPLLLLDQQTGEQFPQLAASWDISADAKQYTFHLRQGITFQSGGQLAPHDVAYTIQRGLLQSDPSGPQWILIRAIMGYDYDITEEIPGGPYDGDRDALIANASPADLQAACEKVKQAVTADDVAGTVTIKLAASDTSFLNILTEYGMVLDQEWVVAQGDWNGNCGTWQNYYAPGDSSALNEVANGTGPFKFQSWVPGSQMVLTRHDAYWRTTPLWPGGPAGPAALSKITFKVISDSEQRKTMLLNGDADIADIDPDVNLDSDVLIEQHEDTLILKNKDGVLYALTGLPSTSAADAFFNFDVETGGTYNYIGSGQLDGDGIPPDFFSDIHVRRAFNHAFNFTTYSNTAYNGKAIRRTGPIIANLMGYSASQPLYAYDPVKAKQELSLAWGGQVASQGFKMTIGYNSESATREKAANLIKSGIEVLDPKYHVDIVALPWSEFTGETWRLPIFISGWSQDYAHPQNWVDPWLFGTYAGRQHLPESMKDQYRTMSQACLTKTGAAAQLCYEVIQLDAYDQAVDLFLVQSVVDRYARAEVRGYRESLRYFSQPYIYALSKGDVPSIDPIPTDAATLVTVAAGDGAAAEITVPAGAVSSAAELVTIPSVDVRGKQTVGFKTSDNGFDMVIFDSSGARLPDAALAMPIEIDMTLTQPLKINSDHEELRLLLWQNERWNDAACGPYVYAPEGKGFTVPVCVTGQFVVGEVRDLVFLPVVITP